MMFKLLKHVTEAEVKQVLAQEVPHFRVQSMVFHHAYADRCIVEVNECKLQNSMREIFHRSLR